MKRILSAAAALLATTALHAAPPPKVAPLPELTPAQLEIAPRVFVGRADCEFAQKIDVQPVPGQPGAFLVVHGKNRYTMVPQETTTGAVRLEDPRAGVVWLQIPAKSMLMNSRIGRRLVDDCMHPEQRSNVAAAAE